MAFGNVSKEELINICQNLNEEVILKTIESIANSEIPPLRGSSTHFVIYKNNQYPLKYVIEFANNDTLNNEIKIGPGTQYNEDSWTAAAALQEIIPNPQNFIVVTPYNEKGQIFVQDLRENLINTLLGLGFSIDNTPKEYTAIKTDKNIAEIHYVQKKRARFKVVIEYDALSDKLKHNCRRVPDSHGWKLNGECWVDSERSLGNALEKIKYIANAKTESQVIKTHKYWLYSAGEKSYKWDEFYKDGIMAIGWDYLGDLTKYSSQEEIANKITKEENRTQYPMNDSKANWEFVKDMHIGDIVYVKKGLQDALIGRGIVKSDYIYGEIRNEYKSIRKVEWTHNGAYDVDFNILDIKQWNQKTLTEISQSKYKDFCLKIEDVFMKKQSEEESNNLQLNIPLNQILYGPPGTGKTFSVRKYIDEILGKNPGLNIENEDQRINNVVKDSNWYSAIALSMYQNGKNNKYKVAELLEQKIIKAFSLTRENKNVRAALWAQMQIHTHENCPNVNYSNRLAPFIFEKNENSEWYLTEDGIKFVEENLSEQLEQLSAKNNTRKLEDFYKFLTFHQSYSYEEFVEGIKPQIRTDEECSSVSYEYNKGIFKEICQQANSDPDNNYLLIIDEINRGNISKIFGELITLIEIDKRVMPNGERIFENTITKDEQLLVTLPYTKSKFGVPNNLYILGTMNTSDRSIASIDIALRRRFKFIEMMPNSNLVADFGCNFKEIFEKLNNKIKILLDRDHQIGHSYFIRTKYADADINILKEIWFSEILPLLNEYFYCDWEKLKLIIPGFIKKLDVPEVLKNECDDSVYEFKTFDEVADFEKALNQEKFEQV